MSTGGLGQGDALGHDRIDLARGQHIEEFRECCAIPDIVRAEIRGCKQLFTIRQELEQLIAEVGVGCDLELEYVGPLKTSS